MDVGIVFSGVDILFNAARAVVFLLYLQEKICVGRIQSDVIPATNPFGRNSRSVVQIYVQSGGGLVRRKVVPYCRERFAFDFVVAGMDGYILQRAYEFRRERSDLFGNDERNKPIAYRIRRTRRM